MTKQCSKCGACKAPAEFYRNRRECKVCTRARANADYHANRESNLARKRAYQAGRSMDPAFREAERQRQRRLNVEQRNSRIAARKRWMARNPGYWHARVVAIGTSAAYRQIFGSVEGMTCDYCGVEATEIDHVVPVSRGGSNDPENLVPACRSCNASKGAKLLSEWENRPAVAERLSV